MSAIVCTDIAKKFKQEVLFKQFNYTFNSGGSYAITGHNSSGKSTLLKILAGVLSPSKGNVSYSLKEVDYERFSFSSPELSLLDDYSVEELFHFHFELRTPLLPISEQIKEAGLKEFTHKRFSELSSGLKNKVKLALSLFTKSPVLLLDEPCTNFDLANTKWYQNTIQKYRKNDLIIIASNNPDEYVFCNEVIHLQDYK
jgi:ABC-type multidrug transport system ATPase subunit